MAVFRRDLTFGSDAETTRFAQALAPFLGPGDVILLKGDLGSGKTHLARSLIQARLAVAGRIEDVPSPTFTLIQVYDDGVSEIWHCDLYRLGGPEEVAELGLEDAFDTAICLVEWPDRLQGLEPGGALSVTLTMTDRPGERRAVLQGDTARWQMLVDRALSERVDG